MSILKKQYDYIKAKYTTALLLFRVNDNYEIFDDDAKIASEILEIPSIKNDKGCKLAGFTYQQLDLFLPKLVRAGHRVVICDPLSASSQKEDIDRTQLSDLLRNPSN
ncbi:MAG: hypothetical protein RID25_23285 [Cyclobacteriaceae bacterium]